MRALAAIQWINLAYVVKRSRGKKTLEVGMLQGERHINCEPTVAKRERPDAHNQNARH